MSDHAWFNPMWLLALAVALLVGCQSEPRVDGRELRPLVDAEGHPRSLAFVSPQQRRAVAAADLPPGLPWYARRNDLRPSVEAGVEPTTLERSFTHTIDRQRIIRGRAFDSYTETRHRHQVTETWR